MKKSTTPSELPHLFLLLRCISNSPSASLVWHSLVLRALLLLLHSEGGTKRHHGCVEKQAKGDMERESVYQALGPGLGMSPSTGALASAESNTRIVHRRACTSSSSQTCMIPSPPLS